MVCASSSIETLKLPLVQSTCTVQVLAALTQSYVTLSLIRLVLPRL